MNNLLDWYKSGNIANFHTTSKAYENKTDVPAPKTTPPPEVDVDIGKRYMVPSTLDKLILIWGKKYKSKTEIPNLVPVGIYNQARNVSRIKLANYTMAFILVGCVFAVWKGKQDRAAGNTLLKKAREWESELKREYQEELRLKAEKEGKN